jgi:hypothetical protein
MAEMAVVAVAQAQLVVDALAEAALKDLAEEARVKALAITKAVAAVAWAEVELLALADVLVA